MKNLLLLIMTIFIFSGCTQIVTAPISIAGTVISTTADVAGTVITTTADVVTSGDDDEDEEEKDD